ncbi:MAG: chromosomal replication initiator protein DnaA [Deltaproteobacteria bacterium]|nr:chromosomal replication initiator protein DnaA [Deltaproteobacteria bacterium]
MRSWQHAQRSLRETLGESTYETWIKPLRLSASRDGHVCLDAPSKFFRDWVERRHLAALKAALRDEVHASPEVVLQVKANAQGELFEPGEPVDRDAKPATRESKPTIAARLAHLVPRYTFENFVVGPSNQLAHAAARAIANNPGAVYNPVFIYGTTGVGKTHLVNAIGHAVFEKNPSAKIVYLSSEAFVNELITCLRHQRMDEFKKRFRSVDVLIVDDVQFLAGRERTQEEFFHTFNTLHEARKQLVLTSDKFPKDIPDLEERLRNRFEWGLTVDIQAPDTETRLAIIQQKAEAEGLTLSSDVAAYIADEVVNNVRELEGALTRLGAHASLSHSQISLEFAKDILRPLLGDRRKQPTTADVQRVVCEHFGLSLNDLKSKRRTQNLVVPRQIAMFLTRRLVNISFPAIGEQFGGRDHSTVIHANNSITSRQTSDATLRAMIERLERTIVSRRSV